MSATTDDAHHLLIEAFAEHQNVALRTIGVVNKTFLQLTDVCEMALSSGGKILLFGNGGSAADAQHIAAELVVQLDRRRDAYSAIALTTDTSILTAVGNDLGFEHIFSRQVAALARPGDVAVGITTSGRSRNILNALAQARAIGCHCVGLTGGDGGNVSSFADVTIVIPSNKTARIQEMHILLLHTLCEALEARLAVGARELPRADP